MKKIKLFFFFFNFLFISCFETTADTIICNNSDTLKLAFKYGDSLYNTGCDIQINDVVIFSDDQEVFVKIEPADTSFNYWLSREIPDHCPQAPCTFYNHVTQLTHDGVYRAYEYSYQMYQTSFSAIKADSSDMVIKLTPAPGSSPVYKASIHDDFKSYQWSNGSTAYFTLIDEPGLYTVNAVTYFGDTLVNSILINDEAFESNQFYTGQKTGDHIHYTDLVPDTTAHYYHGGSTPPYDDFIFDVNQDGISELKYNVEFGSSLGAYSASLKVTPLNGCEILNTGDTKVVLNIEENCVLNQYFGYSSAENMLMYRSGSTMLFMGCHAGRWQDADHYLGFRFPIAGDTAYAWMHISFSTEWSELNLVIDDFAYYSIESGDHEVNGLSFSVYPNPFTNQIKIQSSLPNYSIEVFNILGNRVYQMDNQQENSEIDLGNLSPGIYFLKLESGDKRYTQKLTKR
jgi:hypothetical protein